jgi:hypothetical protein
MKNILKKISLRFQSEGFHKTALYACGIGSALMLSIVIRLKKKFDLKLRLPCLLEQNRRIWLNAPSYKYLHLRQRTLDYIATNEKPEINVGAYSYKPGGPPLLYSSSFAVLTRHLYNDLDTLTLGERAQWISYIQSFQSDDGFFRDPSLDIPSFTNVYWWGWPHMTLIVLMALNAIGGIAQKRFQIIDPFRKKGRMEDWLETRNWKNEPASVSNEIQNYATLLQYARDFQDEVWCEDVLKEMYDWLDRHQDPQTGLWGSEFNTPQLLSYGVQTGYHLWLLYFYDRRPIQYLEQIVDSCLATQNKLGGFGEPLNSSACEDIDTIDPLVRLYFAIDYRRDDILKALEKALPWVMVNINENGGWVFRRYESFQYGHPLMQANENESSMFPTWFRTLSLAYLSKVLSSKPIADIEWRFLKSSGLQFWFEPDK